VGHGEGNGWRVAPGAGGCGPAVLGPAQKNIAISDLFKKNQTDLNWFNQKMSFPYSKNSKQNMDL
jgi:hypothetical protein